MAGRRTRRRDQRQARSARQRDEDPVGQGSLLSRISTDWIVGGIIGVVVLIAIMVFVVRVVFGGGGSSTTFFTQVFSAAVSPGDSSVRLLGDITGLYRTDDAGDDWDRVPVTDQPVYTVVNDPANANGFLAAGDGFLARSEDGGLTWQDIVTDLPSQSLRSLAVDPSDASVIYAYLVSDGLYRSDDAGRTWVLTNAVDDASITSLAVKAGAPDVVYAFHTRRGLVRSEDGGKSFRVVVGGIPSSSVASIVTSAIEPESVFAISGRTIYTSLDDGASWKLTNLGLERTGVIAIAEDAANGDLYVSDFQGLFFRSVDRGKSWSPSLTARG